MIHWYNYALAQVLAAARRIPTRALADPAPARPGDHLITLPVGGMTRTALLHLPPAITVGQPLPLVLMLHGKGSNALHFSHLTGMSQVADQVGGIVVYPQGTDRRGGHDLAWNAHWCCGTPLRRGTDDIGFMRLLIAGLQQRFSIDSHRIYAAGHSNGGILCYQLAAALWPTLAAIAPVAGATVNGEPLPAGPVSLLAIHGTADRAVRIGGSQDDPRLGYRPLTATIAHWVAHNGCAPTPERFTNPTSVQERYSGGAGGSAVTLYTVQGGGHAWPAPAVAALLAGRPPTASSTAAILWDFFAQQPRSESS